MKRTFDQSKLSQYYEKLETKQLEDSSSPLIIRSPVHVVYGGAHLFRAETPGKLGRIALRSLDDHAEHFVEFAQALWLKGADTLPKYKEFVEELEFQLSDNAEKVKEDNSNAWFSWTIYQKTIEKLKTEPVEDFRIDFEDGYGIRPEDEEDGHAISASNELARGLMDDSLPRFSGFRIKSFATETRKRAIRTFDLFLTNFVEKTAGKLPENFVVTLPKITKPEEVEVLAEMLEEFEQKNNLPERSIKLEIVIETPEALINDKGEIALKSLVQAANGRCAAAHFGAYDFTAQFGISGIHQHLQHDACKFARQMMQTSLVPLGIRLSDSVTTEMPIPLYRNENLTPLQIEKNKKAVHNGWRKHFYNVTNSLISGFYQSWDLHPAQLVARYAAVYAFFLESKHDQAVRLRGFIEKATKAVMTGSQFDDAASAQGLLNFFVRARNCGAMTEDEILKETGLTGRDLTSASFQRIMDSRYKAKTN